MAEEQQRKYVRPGDACCKCGKYEVEVIDEWVSAYCGYCNDRLIEQANEQREWNYYHSEDNRPLLQMGEDLRPTTLKAKRQRDAEH